MRGGEAEVPEAEHEQPDKGEGDDAGGSERALLLGFDGGSLVSSWIHSKVRVRSRGGIVERQRRVDPADDPAPSS